MTTVFQDNVELAAYTPEVAIAHERRATVTLAAQLIVDGRPGRAQYEMARSVMRQARIAGLGTQTIAPVCPCGGRCRQ